MKKLIALVLLFCGAACAAGFDQVAPNVYRWTDTCNVYVIRDGENALLIDLGDGSVLDHLAEIGVRRVEWVLFTHHHREQLQGYPKLKPWGAKIAAPGAERALFEHPAEFRKPRPMLEDPFTVYGASYVRPPVQPIAIDRAIEKMDAFPWHGHDIRCLETKGNSPGSMSYFLAQDGRWLAFTGDVMLAGARMHNWFDTEWDYGYASGIYALYSSAALISDFGPALLLPSHGLAVKDPARELSEFEGKLKELARLLVRGYPIGTFAGAGQDYISKPTSVANVWRVSPHLYKFKGPDYWPNMHLLVAGSGNALAFDCGLFDNAFLDHALEGMREKLGLKRIDACIVSHMHGDHMLNARHLREKWGSRVWVLDNMVEKCEHPERFDYSAMVETYEKELTSVPVDRAFKPGETFEWEGYRFQLDWMPGQTEFALCLSGMVDGKRIAFTGDNIFGDPRDPQQTGHEAVVARNSAILEEGYMQGAELLHRLKPDLLLGGHSWLMDRPAGLIERYRQWAFEMRAAFQSLSPEEDYRYWFDPYWVRVAPYRIVLERGKSNAATLKVRNFRAVSQKHHIELHAPAGILVQPAVFDGVLKPNSAGSFQFEIRPAADAPAGTSIVAIDITVDGRRYGEWFDCMTVLKP